MPEYLASSGDHSLFYAAQSFLRFSNGNVQSRWTTVHVRPEKIQIVIHLLTGWGTNICTWGTILHRCTFNSLAKI